MRKMRAHKHFSSHDDAASFDASVRQAFQQATNADPNSSLRMEWNDGETEVRIMATIDQIHDAIALLCMNTLLGGDAELETDEAEEIRKRVA